ncbi:amino acid adenylation domain-containing protein [Lachnospiraceae bacterium 54-53]
MVQALVDKYKKLGVEFWLDPHTDELHFKAISGVMNSERMSELKLNKKELITFLKEKVNGETELPPETRRIRDLVNATEGPVPKGCIQDGFFRNAGDHPERTALISRGRHYTYGELADHAAAVCLSLLNEGIKPGEPAAVIMEKGVWQIASVLGCLLAGAIYLPVDSAQPESRIKLILDSARVRYVLLCATEGKNGERDYGQRIFLDVSGLEKREAKAVRQVPISPDQPAYVIFTSGTTGVPKGVVISHRSALNTIADINEKFRITPEDRILGLANLAFDLSVYDLFGILGAGGTLVLPDPERRKNPGHWEELIVKEKITVWNSVPAQMQMLTENMESDTLPLRLILLSGDWIPVSLPRKIWEKTEGAEVISLGGATEAAIWSIFHPVKSTDAERESIPYGTPLRNQQFYILDENLKECRDGETGGIYIAGTGLAREYLYDEKLTDEKFIFHPLLKKRLYFTGDMGRYDAEGIIEFAGRMDNQVKINGHRMELSEIDHVLQSHPDVAQAVSVIAGEKGHPRISTFAALQSVEGKNQETGAKQEWDRAWENITSKIDRNAFYRWIECADRYALSKILRTMTAEGLFCDLNSGYGLEEIMEKLGAVPEYFQLVSQWLDSLCGEGFLTCDRGDHLYYKTPAAEKFLTADWEAELDRIQGILDFGKDYVAYFKESSEKLSEQLKGEIRALDLLFPQGDTARATALYQDHLCSRYLNGTMTEFIKKTARDFSYGGKTLKILEIGAGVGGTSNYLIPALSGYDVEYHFTDISAFFINEAEKRYENYPYVRYSLLDINVPYWEQGFRGMDYDIMIGNNVFHNAKNCPACLRQLKELLAPKGLLIILDTVREACYMQTSVKFQEGLSSFEDIRGEQGRTFFSRREWLDMLHDIGGDEILGYPAVGDVLEAAGQAVFSARMSSDKSQATRSGIIAYLQSRLPEYMIPPHLELLPELPVTENGKIDRKQLKRRAEAATQPGVNPDRETMDETEKAICRIWCQVLHLEELGRNDNFFENGGDSLLIAQVVTRMKRELKPFETYSWDELLRLSIKSPTIAQLAKELKEDPRQLSGDS